LSAFGFEPAKEIAAETLFSLAQGNLLGEVMDEHAMQLRDQVRKTMAQDLAAKDIHVEWMQETGDFQTDLDCVYIKTEDAGPSELPGALTLVQRIEGPDGAIWILRSQCQGGGTSASQVFRSALMVIDESRMAGRPAREAIVEQYSTENTQFDTAFYDA